MRRAAALASLLAVGLLSAGGTAAGQSASPEPRASLPDIEDEVMCPICGTTLELSEAPQAERERALIRRMIDRGAGKEEIKDALVAEYGEEVLAVPSGEGFGLTAWIVPPVAILLAGGGIALALSRRRGHRGRPEPPVEPLDPADAERLDRELAEDGR